MSSLVRGKYVICKVVGDAEAQVVEDGAVFQQDGAIVDIGRYDQLARKYQPDEVIGSAGHVVMPGFVNSHHHVGLTPFQLGSPDYPLELWLASRLGARDVDPYLDTLYSAFEMVQAGITTVQHLHGRQVGPVSGWPAVTEKILQAYQDIGLRVSYGCILRDQNWLVCGSDADFIQSLPPTLAPQLAAMAKERTIPAGEYFDFFAHIYRRWNHGANGRVRIQLAPANLHWCSDDALLAQRDWSQTFGVGLHMHLLETPYQKEYARRRTGGSAVRHLHTLGCLGPDLTLGHGVWLTEEDVELVAETGTMICHNASSNLRLQSGIAPLNPLLQRDIGVALGLDEASINDDRDMLQEMRLVLNLHRVPGIQSRVPTAAEVFQMATERGAQTTGFAAEIGTLEPGKAADMVVMNWTGIAFPYLDHDVPVVDTVVYRGRPASVEAVMVAGEVIYKDGHFTRIDRDAALRELAASLASPPDADEIRRRELARAVLPHVKRFYEGWLDPGGGDPFYRQNSRR